MEKVLTKGELREWNRIKWKILDIGPKQWAAGVTKSEIRVDMLFGREEGPSGDGSGDPNTMGDDSDHQSNHQSDEEAENISDNESGTELSGREIMRMVENQTSSQVLEKNWQIPEADKGWQQHYLLADWVKNPILIWVYVIAFMTGLLIGKHI